MPPLTEGLLSPLLRHNRLRRFASRGRDYEVCSDHGHGRRVAPRLWVEEYARTEPHSDLRAMGVKRAPGLLHPASGESGSTQVGTTLSLRFRAVIEPDGELEMEFALGRLPKTAADT